MFLVLQKFSLYGELVKKVNFFTKKKKKFVYKKGAIITKKSYVVN